MAQDLSYLFAEQARLARELANLNEQLAYARANAGPQIVAGIEQRIASAQETLTVVQEQIQLAQTQNSSSTVSSGQVITQESQARAEGAVSSNPPPSNSVLAPDGRINRDAVETGTDEPTRTQEQTQSTPPAGDGAPLPFTIRGDEDTAEFVLPPTASTQPGAAANRDDNTRPNNNSASQIINASFNQRITPRANVLDQYASYTYAITWYLLTPEQYNEMTRTQKKNCASWQLLMQSAGAPTQVAGQTANSTATAGRNQFFDKDYYMDDLEIDSLVPLKGTGAANTATDIKFKVTEPNGITLIENLYKAVSTLYKQKNVSKTANYPMAQYCLAIRFYGYDENGELVTTGRRGTNGQTNLTDPRAIVEKFYPFVITNIRFRIPKDRVVEYEVTGKPIPHFYNKSQDRGTIPFAFELMGETLGQVLQGRPVGTVYPASPGERRDTPTPNTSAPTQPPVGAEISPIDDPVAFAATANLGA